MNLKKFLLVSKNNALVFKEVNSMTNVSKELVTVEDFQLLYDDEYV
jgi:hypothetical protein